MVSKLNVEKFKSKGALKSKGIAYLANTKLFTVLCPAVSCRLG